MTLFKKNRGSTGVPSEPEESSDQRRQREKESDDRRYNAYCHRANELPLLTDDELQAFAFEGSQVVVSGNGGYGTWWTCSYDTQFIIRLRRTLIAKFPHYSPIASDPSDGAA